MGCGGSPVPPLFSDWDEVRLDADPESGADLIGDMLDIPMEPDSVDAVFTSHTLEHVTYHDGIRALREFLRVLKPCGRVWIVVPNIGALGELISSGKLYDTLYDSPGGKVCAADMLYGHQGLIERDGGERAYRFAHRFGYTPETLRGSLEAAGFRKVRSDVAHQWDALATGIK